MTRPTKSGRRDKAIVETIRRVRESKSSKARLTTGLVEDIDAVTSAVSPRNRGRLPIETHAKATNSTELTHGGLRAAESVHAHAHRNSTVDTAVGAASRREARRLE